MIREKKTSTDEPKKEKKRKLFWLMFF